MKVAIASDHGGIDLKEDIKAIFASDETFKDIELVDFGTNSTASMDYPDSGFPAGDAVAAGDCERGILVCGSGIGMSIVANKVKGIRGALCHSVQFAELSRLHNNANIIILPGRFISKYLAKDMLRTWFTTDYEGGRHQNRLDKITKYEEGE